MSKNSFWTIAAVMLTGATFMIGSGMYYLSKFGSTFGRVVAAGTEAPVDGAEIEMTGRFLGERTGSRNELTIVFSKTTSEDGSFKVRSTVGGTFTIVVRHPDYHELARDVELAAESDNDVGTFTLVPLLD